MPNVCCALWRCAMVLTHRHVGGWTIPHCTLSRSRFTYEADGRGSGSTAMATAISVQALKDDAHPSAEVIES
jgi:hypothetical protein